MARKPTDPKDVLGPIKGWTAALGNALLAPLCQLCAGAGTWQAPVCKRCSDLIIMMAPGCPLCGAEGVPERCKDCDAAPPPWQLARSFGLYEGPLKEAIHKMKFNDHPQVGDWLGQTMAAAYKTLFPEATPTIVVPVPLPKGRMKQRGYNQAALLATPIAQTLGLPLFEALARKNTSGSQSKVGGQRRRARLKEAFTLAAQVRAHHVLLVDDVFTTGATTQQCTRILLEGGAASVHVYCAARTLV